VFHGGGAAGTTNARPYIWVHRVNGKTLQKQKDEEEIGDIKYLGVPKRQARLWLNLDEVQ
jgi:hypothetical protein